MLTTAWKHLKLHIFEEKLMTLKCHIIISVTGTRLSVCNFPILAIHSLTRVYRQTGKRERERPISFSGEFKTDIVYSCNEYLQYAVYVRKIILESFDKVDRSYTITKNQKIVKLD